MLDYKPRKSEALAAALGGVSSVFFLITFIILGSGNYFSFLAQFHKPPKRCRLHSAQAGADRRSLVLSLSVFTLSECFGALFCSPVSVFLEPRRS